MRFSTLCGLVCGLAVVGLPIAGIVLIGRNIDTSELPSKQTVARVGMTPEDVAARRETLESLQRAGIFGDVGSRSGLQTIALVRDGFYGLPFKTKEIALSNVWVFLFDNEGASATITLVDERTNKKIGRYSLSRGLKLN